MTDISDAIYYFGELGMQEFESTKLLKETLEAAGFKVELGGAGMPTNLWAEWGSGRPKIAIVDRDRRAARRLADARLNSRASRWCKVLPAIWKATIRTAASHSMAAFAVKQVMQRDNIPGTVVVSFGPAEEQMASRPFLVRAGYFKDVDAIIYLHIGDALTPATACRTTPRSARSSPFKARPPTARSIPGTGRTPSTRSS